MNKIYGNLPDSPGVYIMRGKKNKILYIGKASNLRRRVSSYFMRANDRRIEAMVQKIKKVDYKKTDTALEALILEASLIKMHQPPYNVKEKDDKSFFYIGITDEEFPRVFLVRGTNLKDKNFKIKNNIFGPFTNAGQTRVALKIIRKIFPYHTHTGDKVGKFKKACFEAQVGLCPGVCVGSISKKDYVSNIRNIRLILRGKKRQIISELKRNMKIASNAQDYELAERIKRQIFALEHIRETALMAGELTIASGKSAPRIEGYDISNISGTSAVGSMVVFRGAEPDKSQYRKFRIRTVNHADDVGMMKEMLSRRFRREDWPLPGIVLVDGGKAQVNVSRKVIEEMGLKIPVIGMSKGPKRDKSDLHPNFNKSELVELGIDMKTLIKIRDEAHRFAIKYHRSLRSKRFIKI